MAFVVPSRFVQIIQIIQKIVALFVLVLGLSRVLSVVSVPNESLWFFSGRKSIRPDARAFDAQSWASRAWGDTSAVESPARFCR